MGKETFEGFQLRNDKSDLWFKFRKKAVVWKMDGRGSKLTGYDIVRK